MKAILTLFRTAAAVLNENCKSISDTAHYVCFPQGPYSVCDLKMMRQVTIQVNCDRFLKILSGAPTVMCSNYPISQ